MQTTATRIDLADGVLTFYFAPDQNPGAITYDVYGYLPGQYRALPASIRSAYEPGRFHLGPGERAARPGARRAEHRPLQADARRALRPRQGPLRRRPIRRGRRGARAALRRLHAPRRHRQGRRPHAPLDQHPAQTSRARSSSTSRSSRRRPPSWSSPSTSLLAIGKAYRDINEYERAMIVWRGLIEASYLEDARVGELCASAARRWRRSPT